MCGIAGIWVRKGRKTKSGVLEKLAASLNHRGPDDRGWWEDKSRGLSLVHTRLTILDLSAHAHQPMVGKDGRTAITYNGEIYNAKRLKQTLKAAGHSFFSRSDTEVILNAYQEWGEECLPKLEGMFSFALWDHKEQVLLLARDQFGIKPLYYSFAADSSFIFSSEINALTASGLICPQVNPWAVGAFLSLGYIPPPQTFYKNVLALMPGHWMKVSAHGVEVRSYADLRRLFAAKPLVGSYEDAVRRTRTALTQSVSAHLEADVEVGAFLSGGVDSSSLVSLMRQAGQRKIKTITAVFPGTDLDERRFAKKIAQRFDTQHFEVEIQEKDFFEEIERIFHFMDQPTVDGVNTYFVSLAARRAGLKAVLSGVGGDEAFGGYPSFDLVPELFKKLSILRALPGGDRTDKLMALQSIKVKTLFEAKRLSLAKTYLMHRSLWFSDQIREVLSPEWAALVMAQWDFDSYANTSLKGLPDDFSKISFLETHSYLSGQLLRDVDCFSMANSLEVRVPFVHRPLLKELGVISSRHKMGRGPKTLLVDAVGDLPKEIWDRPKKTFTLPFEAWFKQRSEIIFDENLEKAQYLNPKAIQKIRSGFLKGQVHWSLIWSLFVLHKFLPPSKPEKYTGACG